MAEQELDKRNRFVERLEELSTAESPPAAVRNPPRATQRLQSSGCPLDSPNRNSGMLRSTFMHGVQSGAANEEAPSPPSRKQFPLAGEYEDKLVSRTRGTRNPSQSHS
ncbi:hypothetical protein H101_08159 [Trichophyton interdigitale H6]|nr:hypothetical protein H101_08159 [Trichophyton interdigitale H6]